MQKKYKMRLIRKLSGFYLLETNKKMAEYDNIFKTSMYKDNTIYYNSELEPDLKKVYAYIDKVNQDDSKLFEESTISIH